MPQTGPRPIYTAPAAGPRSSRRAVPSLPAREVPPHPAAPSGRRTRLASTYGHRSRRSWRTPDRCTRPAPSPAAQPAPAGPLARRVPALPPVHAPVSPHVPGFGARPGGAPGSPPDTGAGAPPAGLRPARPGQRRGGQRYEKVKEGPMKGFQPPPALRRHADVARASAHHPDHYGH